MATLLKGAEVASAMNERMTAEIAALGRVNIVPTLAILRVGERAEDLAYEKSAVKRCAAVGVEVKSVVLPADVGQAELLTQLEELNRDEKVHGIMYFRPLPAHLDEH